MTTSKEFLEIIEKHLVLQENGNITLQLEDPELGKKYSEFIKNHAKKGKVKNISKELIEINFYCPRQ